ncbi:MAG TPA: 5-(carboxyamino)imidazole ribonucleotide mutase [Candidatus Kapabacteria bacterium]|nr:5-(carboxyamino)imidazole ribonucleotide mutase [Candidatus Kapabacteria bacterium]HPO63463.1 5-(carboxyamino)imidazole ribonucleotide mutase [Candidatus Kapabacteria bacterium]
MKEPKVAIIMGSDSDLPTMREAAAICQEFEVAYEMKVVSAHRTPIQMIEYGKNAHLRGFKVVIAGAGGAAHLPGMIAACTPLPVIGVPIKSKALSGLDSLLSIVQMPPGVPVATVAIGAGRNAGILAMQILGSSDEALRKKVENYKLNLLNESQQKNKNPEFTQ